MNGAEEPRCFVVMPFTPELHFFYLFVKQHLETSHGISVYRGDDWVETRPLVDKIRSQIDQADVIVADLTGASPNVLYEVGWAHARGIEVIFLTQDDPAEAPVDLQGYEVITYDLVRDAELIERLDSAFARILRGRFAALYEQARELLTEFNRKTGRHDALVSEEDFRLLVVEKSLERLDAANPVERVRLLLPNIVEDPRDPDFMAAVTQYLTDLEI